MIVVIGIGPPSMRKAQYPPCQQALDGEDVNYDANDQEQQEKRGWPHFEGCWIHDLAELHSTICVHPLPQIYEQYCGEIKERYHSPMGK